MSDVYSLILIFLESRFIITLKITYLIKISYQKKETN